MVIETVPSGSSFRKTSWESLLCFRFGLLEVFLLTNVIYAETFGAKLGMLDANVDAAVLETNSI